MSLTKEMESLYLAAGEVYTPSAPIDQRKLFAGRIEQLSAVVDALRTKGQHVVVYGERGVGKTSLISILSSIAWTEKTTLTPTVRHNCHRQDTFARLWQRALESVRTDIHKPGVGFVSEAKVEVATLADQLAKRCTPDQVVTALRRVSTPLVFIFDEFDQLADKDISNAFAETMKALSDYAVPAKIVLVGVGDTVDALIASHASVERAMRQVRMPRMQVGELAEIVKKASAQLGVTCDEDATDRIVRIAQGLPHYVHSIGLQSTRAALKGNTKHVTIDSVNEGIAKALTHASQSLLDAYMKAISSPQKDSLYRHVLLACALSETDDLACFAPASVRVPLRVMGRNLEIPAFAGHLNKFTLPDRGNVLRKMGARRRYRYRFSNPLLQPFVVIRGIADGLINADSVDDLLAGVAVPAA